jgi:hypothetical protein
MGQVTLCLAVVLAPAADGALSGAQTAAGGVGTLPDFSGTWMLDRSLSVDTAAITLGPGTTGGGQAQQHRSRGGFGGFGSGGGGGFGGSRRGDQSGAGALTANEQQLLKTLSDQLNAASNSLAISHHDPSFVVNDSQNHTMFPAD